MESTSPDTRMPDAGEILERLSHLAEENRILREEVRRLSGRQHAGEATLQLLNGLSKNELAKYAESGDSSHDCQCIRLMQSCEVTSEMTLSPAGRSTEVVETLEGLGSILHLLLHGIPFGVSYCDKELLCAYRRVYNEPENDPFLKEILENRNEQALEMKRTVLSGNPEKKDFRFEIGGRTRFIVMICQPFHYNGRIEGIITILMDNTAQVAMGANFAKLRAESEQWGRTELDLRQAIKAADEAIQAKNTFLAVMSHEIRTPLNGVLGMAQVLATTTLDTEQKELVDAMVFSGDVLLAIISDILDLTKVESGTMKLEEREFNPRNLVKHVVRTATAATKDRGIKIEVDIARDVPTTVIGDPLRLKQVITNLVFNAVKFTKEGHVRVRLKTAENSGARRNVEGRAALKKISVHENQSSHHRVRTLEMIPEDFAFEHETHNQNAQDERDADTVVLQFAVEDTGIGIPEEAFPFLFEKFTQVHSSTTRKYGGTGLGLAICKQLVELMGGRIWVTSRVGEGSTFLFTLRCRCPDPTQKEDRHVSQTTLNNNLSYTTAHVHKLKAGLSRPSTSASIHGLHSAPSCPLPKKLEEENGRDFNTFALKENKAEPGRLRRTSSGPPRIECSLMADVEESKDMQIISNSKTGERRHPRLLLAEDNKVNVMVALSMLKRLGLSADVAFNGQEAISAIQNNHYDLVLMDVCMPVLDGLEVTRRVRLYESTGSWETSELPPPCSLTHTKRLPIVAMTANAFSDCEEQCVRYGMDSFVTKPITFKKLKNVLQLFLERKNKNSEASSHMS